MLESLINKFASLQYDLHFYYKGIPTQVYSCEYCEIFKNIYFKGNL